MLIVLTICVGNVNDVVQVSTHSSSWSMSDRLEILWYNIYMVTRCRVIINNAKQLFV